MYNLITCIVIIVTTKVVTAFFLLWPRLRLLRQLTAARWSMHRDFHCLSTSGSVEPSAPHWIIARWFWPTDQRFTLAKRGTFFRFFFDFDFPLSFDCHIQELNFDFPLLSA